VSSGASTTEVADAADAEYTETDGHLSVCQYCGCYIDKPAKQCSALDEGRCSP